MGAIFRREFKSYFTSPIGYIFFAVFFFFGGLYFYTTIAQNGGTNDMRAIFSGLFSILMFLIPILTMRIFSEEKRQRTDQALLTAPISLNSLVFGKFLAALLVFTLALCITLVYAVIIAALGAAPEWAVVFGHFIGTLLLGAALIAIGMFMSSLTENQIVAAVATFTVILVLLLASSFASMINIPAITTVVDFISLSDRYNDFTLGMLNFANVIYFLSITAVFSFLTMRVLEKKRWS
jgi:ABC-2 type transport system permease protein